MVSRFQNEGVIYGLGEPIVYVGQAVDGHRRYREHLRAARAGDDTPVHRWLLTQRWPKLTILETAPVDGLDEAERRWIARLNPIYNSTAGGAGMSAPSTEARAKMGQTQAHIAVDRASKKPAAKFPERESNALKAARTIAMRECGNPDWRKCGICGQYDNPANLVRKTSGGHVHVACRTEQDRLRRSK